MRTIVRLTIQQENPLSNEPVFSNEGEKHELVTPFMVPYSNHMLSLVMTNIPLDDGKGGYRTLDPREIIWLCTDVDIDHATPEQMAQPDVQALLQYTDANPVYDYQIYLRVEYGRSDIMKLDDIKTPGLVDHIGNDIVSACRGGLMDVIVVDKDSSPTGSYVVDEVDGKKQRRQVRRDFKVEVNLHHLYRAFYEDAQMFKPGARIRRGKDLMYFTAQVVAKDVISGGVPQRLAFCFGEMPRSNCEAPEHPPTIQPRKWGKGRIIFLDAEVFNMARESAIRYLMGMHAEWLKLHPSPMSNPHRRPKTADPSSTANVMDDAPTPELLKASFGELAGITPPEEAPEAESEDAPAPSA